MPLFGSSPASNDSVAALIAGAPTESTTYFPGALAETIPAYAATTAVTLTTADVLDGGTVLPGFALSVHDLFAELDRHG